MDAKLRERINLIRNELGFKKVMPFAKEIGIETRTLTNQLKTTAIPAETLLAILFHYPDLSAEWLLRGDGEMFLSKTHSNQPKAQEPRPAKITLELEVGNDKIIKMRLKDKVIQLAE